MKKNLLLLLAALLMTLSFSGSVLATDKAAVPKIVLNDITETNTVKLYDYRFNGIALQAKMDGDTLFIKADNSLPLLASWDLIDGASVKITLDSQNDVVVSLGNKPSIELKGQPQELTDTIKSELQNGYFPLRYVYELAGYTLGYDPEQNAVTLQKNS